jgi:hypothetical protein
MTVFYSHLKSNFRFWELFADAGAGPLPDLSFGIQRYNTATASSPSSPPYHSLPFHLFPLPISPPPPPPPHPAPRLLARRPGAARRRHRHGALHGDEEGHHALRGPEARHFWPPQKGLTSPSALTSAPIRMSV